jgi:hypothetical protein
MKRLLPLALGVSLLGSFACDDKKADEKKSDDKKTDAKKADAKKTDAKDEKKAEAKTDAKADEAKADATPTTAAVKLALGKAKIWEKSDPKKPIEIAEDGTVTMEGQVGAKVTAEGKVTSPDGANVLMEVGADGKVSSSGKELGVVLADDGASFDIDGKKSTMTFKDDGTVVMDPKPDVDDELQHEGCVGPLAKTCALVMVGVLFVDSPAPAPGPKTGGEPPKAAEAKAPAPK